MSSTAPLLFAVYYMRVSDKERLPIDWTNELSNFWAAGTQETTSSVVRPSAANGYEYACTQAGETGSQEPKWPTTVGAAVNDGSAVWTCQVASNASLLTTVSSVAWNATAGLTVSGQTISGQLASALVDASAAVAGTDYFVNCVATMADGEIETGQLKIKVR